MGNDLERLNRLLDDLAAERDVAERAALSAADVALAETAAFLKAVDAARLIPSDAFVRRLGAQLAAARQHVSSPALAQPIGRWRHPVRRTRPRVAR